MKAGLPLEQRLAALHRKVTYLREVLNAPTDIIFTVDPEWNIVEFNRGAQRTLEYARPDVKGKPMRDLFLRPEAFPKLQRFFRRMKGAIRGRTVQLKGKTGETIDALISFSAIKDKDGRALGAVCVARDIRRQLQLQRELQAKTDFLENVLSHSAMMIITADLSGNITEFNPAAERILGYTRQEMIGGGADILYLRKSDRRRVMDQVMKRSQVIEHDVKIVTKDKRVLDVAITMSILRDDEGKPIGTVSVSRDVTEENRLHRRLERLSLTDTLTELYNRRYFYAELEKRMRQARQEKTPLTLILFDIDGFKRYNDKRGHLAGDGILTRIARIVEQCIRRQIDVPCRYGGDEFIVLLPQADAAAALIIAERIRGQFARSGFEECSLSLGIAQWNEGEGARKLIQHADEAMYTAKRRGGNQVEIF